MSNPILPGQRRWKWSRGLRVYLPVRVLSRPNANDRALVVPAGVYRGSTNGHPVKAGLLLTDEEMVERMEERRAVSARASLGIGQTWNDRRDPFVGRVVEIDAEQRTATLRCVREPQRSIELPLSAWTEPGRMKLVGNAPAPAAEKE